MHPGTRILIVDDDPMIGRALMRRLAGHDATIATDGASAMEKVVAAARAGAPFDVVLCDLHMPDLSGLELFSRLRTLPDTPILVLMSGRGLATAGHVADGVLVKPFRTSEAFDLIAGIMAQRGDATPCACDACAAS